MALTPQEKAEFEKLKKQVEDLQLARDVVFTESLRKRMLDDYIESGTATTPSTSDVLQEVDEGGAAVYNVAKAFDEKISVEIGGNQYYLGVYNQ